MRAATTALVVLLCAHASFAQQQDETIPSPKIVTVTPGDGQAVIGFVPPEQTSLEIRNYVVDCEQPDDIRAGVLEGMMLHTLPQPTETSVRKDLL